MLSQQLSELTELQDLRVREVCAHYKTRYELADGTSMGPMQLLEELGFEAAQMSCPVKDLSGGQKRRLQLMLILLDRPNVLILDEPGNDLDTDMLAVLEDLLDSWPGTLLVVSHDRYLMERVTDDQYALIDGHVRHCPGGVDEYLSILSKSGATATGTRPGVAAAEPQKPTRQPSDGLSNAERRELKKRFDAVTRKLDKLRGEPDRLRAKMASAPADDFEKLMALQQELDATLAQTSNLEDEWLELSDRLGLD